MLSLDDLIKPNQHIPIQKPIAIHKHKTGRSVGTGFWEVTKVAIVILASFLIGNIITNAQLYGEKLHEYYYGIQQIATQGSHDSAKLASNKKQEYLDLLFKTQGASKKHNSKTDIYAYYKTRQQSLDYQFNTLPPDRRIIIPDLGIQAPIVTVEGDVSAKMKEGLFSDELKKGTVWYPTTPGPNEPGTTMIFGHTSNYFWVKSNYNTVFSKIPKLAAGQTIRIIWDGKSYEYIVKEQTIVKPEDVPKAYAKGYDSQTHRLAIMGCYPVGTTNERVIVFAEPKGNDHNNQNLAMIGKKGEIIN